MHLEERFVSSEYKIYRLKKYAILIGCLAALVLLVLFALKSGDTAVSYGDLFRTLRGDSVSRRLDLVVWNIRLPQVLAAILAGATLSISGVAMQSVLRNPLGSPFTLGISNAGAFGAALSVVFFQAGAIDSRATGIINISNAWLTTGMAFLFCMLATFAIMAIAQARKGSSQTMVLGGVAISSLFTAATMFLQYFADDVQLAATVFWTFGDLARAKWGHLAVMAVVSFVAFVYFLFNRWNLNALDSGEELAASLGVNVRFVRISVMLMSSMATAVTVSFLGVIGFVGLVCPHIARRILGEDHRFLLLGSCLIGALLLLASDTLARTVMLPRVLPVSIVTSFIGAPMFILMLLGDRR